MLRFFDRLNRAGAPAFLYVAIATPLATSLGLVGGRYVLPALNALVVYPLFLLNISGQRSRRNFALMLFWAFVLSTTTTALTCHFPDLLGSKIIRGNEYKAEMFAWIKTGVGAEGDARRFVSQHVVNFFFFVGLTVLSIGFLGLTMGAIQLNYMSFYVGQLFLASDSFLTILFFGWPVWAILRVIGYILVAIVLCEFFLARLRGEFADTRQLRRYLNYGIALVLADLILKAFLNELWRRILHGAIA